MPSNVKDEVVFETPATLDERNNLANACVRDLGIEFPALVDDLDDSTEIAYTAWPDRMFVIDRDGKVAYKTKPGPFGFKPGEVEETLKRLLGT